MDLKKILEKIDAQIVKIDKRQNKLVLMLRVSKTPVGYSRWKSVLVDYIGTSGEKLANKEGWTADVSQAYFLDQNTRTVRYLWRIIVTGSVKSGAEALGRAVMRSLAQGNEVKEMPLVGQKQYDFDPANGKMKGGHDLRKAGQIISTGIGGGSK